MDFSKYPFEKLFYFVAGIIPGFVALLIFERAAPGSFGWFFSMGFLGYRTKLALVLLVAFLVGNSMTTFLSGLLGSAGGIVGAITALRRPYTPPHSYEVAPWRDPKWRTALKHYLGPEAPKDTRPFFQELLTLMQKEVDYLPEPERPGALAKLRSDKLNAEIDDGRWEQWYDHYHRVVLSETKREPQWYVGHGLNFNLETAALYVLVSAFFVPDVRRLWIILPACAWVLGLTAEEYSSVNQFTNKWSTLSEQIKYLMAQEPLKGPAKGS